MPRETASASAQPQLERPCKQCEAIHGPKQEKCSHGISKKESAVIQKQSSKFRFVGRLKEVDQDPQGGQGKRFRVTLIQEGLGNLDDCFYYTADAIKTAAPLFEGAKYFVDHPTSTEEQTHPERSVRDIAGYFENVSPESDQDGRMNLMGDLCMLSGPSFDQYRSLMLESLAYSQKHAGDLVGLSINASGDFDTIALEQFLKESQIPESCKPKLMEAQSKGITMIRPVREMTSAFSCDLVTTAGAGGKINTLLEQEKSKMAKQGKHEEKEEESVPGAAGAKDGAAGDADGASGEHPDAEQDKDLVMSMLKKYLGDGFSDQDKAMAKEAYEHAVEMGMEHNEAMKCAGYNMKMAKHLQAKQGQANEAGDAEQMGLKPKPKAVGAAGSVPGSEQHAEAAKEEESEEKHKESARGGNTMVKMAAEIARLRQELDAMNLKEFTDKSLRESGLPMAATKKFRECIKDVKNPKEFSEKLAIFKEAYGIRGEANAVGFILGSEKQGDVGTSASLSFADCVEE